VSAQRRSVLVTGGAGFLGSAIARALLDRGDPRPVRVMVRGTKPQARLRGLDVEIVPGDVTGPTAELETAFAGVDEVFHAAGRLGGGGATALDLHRVHVEGTVNVVRAASRARVRRVTYLSSPGLLGPSDSLLDEDAPAAPSNAYERSKADAEAALRALAEHVRTEVVLVRPEFVYGPGDTHVLRLFQAIRARRFVLVSGGRAFCHPTFVSDAVSGILAASDRGVAWRTYHVAGPRPVTIAELATTFGEAVGVVPRLSAPAWLMYTLAATGEAVLPRMGLTPPLTRSAVDFFARSRMFSTRRAAEELGWRPRVDLAQGVDAAVAWYRKHGLLPDPGAAGNQRP
jgi:nucleoside-diphosphate-sugar epimerase